MSRSPQSPPPYDILLCCGKKDYKKLPFVLEGLGRNLEGFDGVYLVSPTAPATLDAYPQVRQFRDPEVLDIDVSRWRYRPNWIYQQFLKLFQTVTPNDLYLVVDCDVIVNRPLRVFEEGRPVMFLGRDQCRGEYFRFQEKVLGFGRTYDHSFISDTMFCDRRIVDDMLSRTGTTRERFIEASFGIIDEDCFISEQELYGNYTMKYFPERYVIRRLRTTFVGKEQSEVDGEMWSTDELREAVARYRGTDYDLIALHSWIVPCDRGTLRGRIARRIRKLRKRVWSRGRPARRRINE